LTISGETNAVNVVASGVITATTELNSPLIGVGTDTPANDIQVRKSGNAEIQVTSDTGIAGLTVGREAGTGNTNNAEFRYGGGSGFTYSSAQSLDIINYGTGNFNYHLSTNNPGAVQGDFHWHRGPNNVRLMTLTNTGRLGIGITQPTDELDIVGGATVSGDVVIGNNLTVSGSVLGNVQGDVTGNLTGNVTGLINSSSGISSFTDVNVIGIQTTHKLRVEKFAVNAEPDEDDLVTIGINTTTGNKILINEFGQVGIRTSSFLENVVVNASLANVSVLQIGVGVTQFNNGSVNFADAGGDLIAKRYMVPPKVTTTQRGNFTGLVAGAMIYNTSTNRLELYNGTGWVGLATVV